MAAPTPVADAAHTRDRIATTAEALARSAARLRVFEIVYRGGRKPKKFSKIARLAGGKEKTIYGAAKYLDKIHVIHQAKVPGQEIAYQKDPFLDAHKRTIVGLARNRARLAKFPTSTNPRGTTRVEYVKPRLPQMLVRETLITVDQIDSFSRVRRIKPPTKVTADVLEDVVKRGIQRIIGEPGVFHHWPGERSDLYTTRVRFRSQRVAAAIAFKGRGTKKKLTPRDMGSSGNQIQRLFWHDADLFIVQHVGQIDESIVDQMHDSAVSKSYSTGRHIYYGTIDGADTLRLMAAYPEAFR